jgi:predicted transcriptional regulator
MPPTAEAAPSRPNVIVTCAVPRELPAELRGIAEREGGRALSSVMRQAFAEFVQRRRHEEAA